MRTRKTRGGIAHRGHRTGTAPHGRASTLELGNTLEFLRLLWRLEHVLEQSSKRMLSRLGITGPQRLVIRIVGHAPGVSAGELARTLSVHPSTLTGVLRRLEARGLLSRHPDPEDSRRMLLRLTPTGRALDQRREGTVEAVVETALRRLTPAQRAAAERALAIVADSLES